MTPSELFDRACLTLWGDQYVAIASMAFKVDKNTIGKWRAGKSSVPFGVWNEVAALLQAREEAIPRLRYEVLALADRLAPFEQEIAVSRRELRSFHDHNIENPVFLTMLQSRFDAFVESSLHGNRAKILPADDGFSIRLQKPLPPGDQMALKAWVHNEAIVICDLLEPKGQFPSSVRVQPRPR